MARFALLLLTAFVTHGSFAAENTPDVAQSFSRWDRTRNATGLFTAVAGGWGIHETPGIVPKYCSVSWTTNPKNGHAFILFQAADLYETVNKTTTIGNSVTGSYDDVDGTKLPPNAPLQEGNIPSLMNEKAKKFADPTITFTPGSQAGEGTLTLKQDTGAIRFIPVLNKNSVEYVDTETLEVETTTDLSQVRKVHFTVVRKKPSILNLINDGKDSVTEWTQPTTLTDVTCYDLVPDENFK